jgi:WD40 repeat protein
MTGHSNSVFSVAFSPDGKHIVSSSLDETIRLWDAQTGQSALEPMTGHSDSVNSVAIFSDGKHIVLGSENKTTQLWETFSDYCTSKGMVFPCFST